MVHEEELLLANPLKKVPPVGEVWCGENQDAPRLEAAAAFPKKPDCVQQMFNDLPGEDCIEALIVPW
jgi:hypothetical protein